MIQQHPSSEPLPETESISEKNASGGDWQTTQYSNLIRYRPSGKYYARVRIKGKLIVKSLKTTKISVAKLRLSDLEKSERQKAENRSADASTNDGRMTFGDALAIYRNRLNANLALKPRSKVYREERIAALLKTWPGLDKTDVRRITKGECFDWAAKFGEVSSPIAFNNTLGTLRHILDIACESGHRYDNPAQKVKRVRARPKKLQLPTQQQFKQLIESIEKVAFGPSYSCADLVRFLAYGGFRKGEAARITWADCDLKKGEIAVNGDPETGTKNWCVRRVPMIPEMRALLERLREDRSDEPLTQPVMRVRECQGAINNAVKKIEMARITHHDLRHLFATRCIESGVDIPTVARWLGHKDGGALAMKTYRHLRDERIVQFSSAFQPSLRDSNFLARCPGVETPGYVQEVPPGPNSL
ncbi:MAG: site-specific integrase [Verrucomicrobia bacterium]|nr:site-specific integrase [Verrucomicrobiota bacterium]